MPRLVERQQASERAVRRRQVVREQGCHGWGEEGDGAGREGGVRAVPGGDVSVGVDVGGRLDFLLVLVLWRLGVSLFVVVVWREWEVVQRVGAAEQAGDGGEAGENGGGAEEAREE